MSAARYSNLVRLCEDIWQDLQREYPDIPDAFVTVASGGRSAATLYGHFANDAWQMINDDGEEKLVHEVLLVAEQLKRPAEQIFTTLLHEAVHGIATVRKIKDVSGKRHNKKFAALCTEVGLYPPEEAHPTLGFSAATLGEEAIEKWENRIADLEKALVFARRLKLKEKETRKTTWVAMCECGRKIRIGKNALAFCSPDEIFVDCKACKTPFVLEEDEELEKLWAS